MLAGTMKNDISKIVMAIIALFLIMFVSACSYSVGLGVKEESTDTTWKISWKNFNGELTPDFNFNLEPPAKLLYVYSQC